MESRIWPQIRHYGRCCGVRLSQRSFFSRYFVTNLHKTASSHSTTKMHCRRKCKLLLLFVVLSFIVLYSGFTEERTPKKLIVSKLGTNNTRNLLFVPPPNQL